MPPIGVINIPHIGAKLDPQRRGPLSGPLLGTVGGTLALLKGLSFAFFRLKLTHITWEDTQGEGKGRKKYLEFPAGTYRR
jgi:hypothetical protein